MMLLTEPEPNFFRPGLSLRTQASLLPSSRRETFVICARLTIDVRSDWNVNCAAPRGWSLPNLDVLPAHAGQVLRPRFAPGVAKKVGSWSWAILYACATVCSAVSRPTSSHLVSGRQRSMVFSSLCRPSFESNSSVTCVEWSSGMCRTWSSHRNLCCGKIIGAEVGVRGSRCGPPCSRCGPA